MKESKTVLDSEFHAVDSGYQVPDYLSVDIEFLIAIISGIPDSLSCIPDSKNQESGFHKQNHIQDSGFRILLHGANSGSCS